MTVFVGKSLTSIALEHKFLLSDVKELSQLLFACFMLFEDSKLKVELLVKENSVVALCPSDLQSQCSSAKTNWSGLKRF